LVPLSGIGIASTSEVLSRRHCRLFGATAPWIPSTPPRAVATRSGSLSPSTRISFGSSEPSPIPARSSATSPSLASPERAIVLASEVPSCRSVAAKASAPITASPAAAPTQRRRATARAQRVQVRLALSSVRRWGQSRRGPSFAITTGSSVIATSVETSGINIPP
jgi:hypothetical protein